MGKVHWTGHPFVDAGLAALAAVVDIQDWGELTSDHLQKAAEELERVLLSEQSLGVGVDKSFATYQIRYIFPNSELVNPTYWKGNTLEEKVAKVRNRFREVNRELLELAQQCLQSNHGEEICFTCGERRPNMVFVRKDKMPLLGGIVNFYPAFEYGFRICGLCAFVIRFLPFSVMSIGGNKCFWFLHTQDLPLAKEIARIYGCDHFDRAIASDQPLEFFEHSETAGDAGAILLLLCELYEKHHSQLQAIYKNPRPTTAYLFSNDNRRGYVQALSIPNRLLRMLEMLYADSPKAFTRFKQELLQVAGNLDKKQRDSRQKFVQDVAQRFLKGEPMLGTCLKHDEQEPYVYGGWQGHRLYLEEMRGMSAGKIAILERLGTSIAQREDANRRVQELHKASNNQLFAVLLRYVKDGLLTHDEFYTLIPPNDYRTAEEARDILLAVIYEWQHCSNQGKPFPQMLTVSTALTVDEALQRLKQIGQKLINGLPNLSRCISDLQTARSTAQIRAVYLRAVRNGAIGFEDFLFLAPLGDRSRLWLLRDYLLAFLFSAARNDLPEQEDIAAGEEVLNET